MADLDEDLLDLLAALTPAERMLAMMRRSTWCWRCGVRRRSTMVSTLALLRRLKTLNVEFVLVGGMAAVR